MKSVVLFAPAKINIGLYVGSKRDDGYHEISSLMVPLQLEDQVKIEVTNSNSISVICKQGEKVIPQALPQDSENICYKAAKIFLEKNSLNVGLLIEITKNIPLSAGLGGGSSDAASVLLGLNELFELKLSVSDLLPIAESIGSDVPFFLYKSPAIVEGVGGKVTPIRLAEPLNLILVNPGFPISTARAYSILDSKLTAPFTGAKPPSLQGISAFRNFSSPVCLEMLKEMKNCFENVAFEEFPELNEIKRSLYNLGSELVLMTGSGPTVFALFSDKLKAWEAFSQLKVLSNWRAFLTRTR